MKEHDTLRLTRPMMHGAAVRRLQELGDLMGYDLGPNDGIFGEDTQAVVYAIQRHEGLKVDGICGPKTWRALLDVADDIPQTVLEVDGVVDRRGLHPSPKLYGRRRRAYSVTSVVLHQTGCEMPRNPSGWDRLNAHLGITQEGILIIQNDPLDLIHHAQRLSSMSIGIEIEGNFCGIGGDMSTLWKGGGGPHRLNQKMLDALDRAFRWLKQWFDMNGAFWRHIYAHRQSKDTRIADPGQEIWEMVALPWLFELENVDDGGKNFCIGSGRPIPMEWAAGSRPPYYER